VYSHTQTIPTFLQPTDPTNPTKVDTLRVKKISGTDKSDIPTCVYTHTQSITTFPQPTVPTNSKKNSIWTPISVKDNDSINSAG